MYVQDYVHFNAEGADLHARTVVSALKALRPSPVRGWLSAKGDSVRPDPLVGLGLSWPPTARVRRFFLVGNSTGAQRTRRRRARPVGLGRLRRPAVRHDEDQRG
jgi:hypothetical protein